MRIPRGKAIPSFEFVLKQFEFHNYKIRKRDFEVNLVGLRDVEGRLNYWDDFIGAIWWEKGYPKYMAWPGTTKPGHYYLIDRFFNPYGCAVVLPGQYVEAYRLGMHKGKYEAFTQFQDVRYFRDSDRNDKINATSSILQGILGLNIHTTTGLFPFVNKWSAGCQVVQSPEHFKQLLAVGRKHRNMYGNKFDYTLLEYRIKNGR